ncbi:urease accessory protein UreF [Bifidobacterium sp. 82T24]|uniref:Urease accessory protein UreF n=2 Tax=Bifidobacterium TaxID=1678 RepID=A0ABX0CA52_9BIFI|nr:urease accessory protein UreF [Bifidobacterium pluvialisilvae]NEG97009.1 urease accessory protein UreF [Bifidobacterium sp. SMB2]NEH12008.1 urease accessory protein UreF [Bifidobacterium saimiriisciurei]
MSDDEIESRHLAMLQVCDSVFPIGAFALSNGMETFVQRDFLRKGPDFEQYLKNYLEVAPYKEIGQMVIAGKYAQDARLSAKGLERKITELDELASALQSAREIREGSERMCARLIKLVDKMDAGQGVGNADIDSRSPHLSTYRSLIAAGRCRGLHSIAMGLYAADHAASLRSAAVTYGYSLISALTMCAAKAIPLSQFAGQVALHDSFPNLVHAVDVAFTLRPDDLGISGAYLDIAAMQHETLYSRLYMS